MQAHVGALYVIGGMHTVCEDYARVVPHPERPHIVVADGCSASKDTDIGARFLALAASAYVSAFPDSIALEPKAILLAAERLARECGLPQTSLDATLLMARLVPKENGTQCDTIRVTCFGDGAVACRRRATAEIVLTTISFPRGAPYYLSYLLCAERYRALVRHGLERVVRRAVIHPGELEARQSGEEIEAGSRVDVAITIDVPLAEYDLVALFSDGVETFVDRSAEQPQRVPVESVIAELLAFKNYHGRFVERRMRRFLRQTRERGWVHEDDLSLAVLYRGDDPC